jgi:phospholipid/cholesterol/gamma-HCH transport system substrate-binding protein
MKSFRERNPLPLGLQAVVVVVLVIAVVLNINSVIGMFGRHYSAEFAEAGGLKQGDPVVVSGLNVGRVNAVELGGQGVIVDFTINNGDIRLGSLTSAGVEVATVLGDKALTLTSSGPGDLNMGARIPLGRTTSPYDVSQALADLTNETGAIDVTRVTKALNTISATFDGVTPEFKAALGGISRLAETIGSRDATLRALLSHANAFSQVLADRSRDMTALVRDGNLLFGELLKRRRDIDALLGNVSSMASELTALVDTNGKIIGPALQQLNGVIHILQANKDNLEKALRGLSVYATGLGEVVASGPFFAAYLQNLLPGNLLTPTINMGRPSIAGTGAN